MPASSSFEDYTIAWIAPLRVEAKVALALMTQPTVTFTSEKVDDYVYIGGEISGHKVVLATLPKGTNHGPGAAASLVNQVKLRFPNIWFALLVGVAAGLPNLTPERSRKRRDIRLGDVLVCVPDKKDVGVLHYDLGTDDGEDFVLSGRQAETPSLVRAAFGNIELTKLHPFKRGNDFAKSLESLLSLLNGDPDDSDEDDQFSCPDVSSDELYTYVSEVNKVSPKLVDRKPRNESERTKVFYGSIGSGGTLMRNHKRRDELRDRYNLIGLEMEAAGIMNTLPTGMIRGVCDYGDQSKNKDWQPYAAAVAAVYAKGVLDVIQVKSTKQPPPAQIRYDSTLPQRLTPHFTGREKYLKQIEALFQHSAPSHQRVVLWGLEGIGTDNFVPYKKSQIALKYANDCSSARSTFWVKAGTRNQVLSDLDQIVTILRKKAKDPGIITYSRQKQIQTLLGDDTNGDWLLVLNGADDTGIFTDREADFEPLDSYIPSVPHGRILITTTDAKVVGLNNGMFAPAQNGINVTPLTTSESVALLQNSTASNFHQELGISNKSSRERMVRLLDCVPIAICQAIAQIRDGVTLEEFIQDFEDSRRHVTSSDTDLYPDSGRSTFELSYRRLCKAHSPYEKLPEARLLDVLSCFDGREIPKQYLETLYKTELNCGKPFSIAIARLRSLSLVEYTASDDCYWILSIIQKWTYERLTDTEKKHNEAVVHKALMLAASKTPSRLALALQAQQIYDGERKTGVIDEADFVCSSLHDSPYRVRRKLGIGASGEIDEVEKISGTNTGRVYARKVVRNLSPGDLSLNVGRHEAELLRQLRHKHIIECIATISTPDMFALILHPVGEYDLAELILHPTSVLSGLSKGTGPSEEDFAMVCRWLGCLAEAVDFIHSQNILLGDIKPHNIIVHRGKVIFIDFGYSVSTDSAPNELLEMPATHAYTAPERDQGTRTVVPTSSRTKNRPQGYGRPVGWLQAANWDERIIETRYRVFPLAVAEYMSAPETMHANLIPNLKSDINSLGCVFVEVLNHLTGESESTFASYRRADSRGDISYANSTSRVLRWIWYLFTKYGGYDDTSCDPTDEHSTSSPHIPRALLVDHVTRWCFMMLQLHTDNRCSATQLGQMIAASRLPLFCSQCQPKLVPHKRFLHSIKMVKASSPKEALYGKSKFTWDKANRSWTSGLQLKSGPLRL